MRRQAWSWGLGLLAVAFLFTTGFEGAVRGGASLLGFSPERIAEMARATITPANLEGATLTRRPAEWRSYRLWHEDFEKRFRDREGLPPPAPLGAREAEFERDARELYVDYIAALDAPNLRGRDLRNADMRGAFLPGTNLERAQMQGAVLSRAQMQGAYLYRAEMQRAFLRRAEMQGANLSRAEMQAADLRGALMQGADLSRAQMQRAVLSGMRVPWVMKRCGEMVEVGVVSLRSAQMQGADMREAEMQGADLHGAQMQGADLGGAQMQGADLRCDQIYVAERVERRCAQMQRADLRGVEMQGADLRGAQMQGADMREAEMTSAECSASEMQGAALHAADILCASASLTQDQLEYATGDNRTRLPKGVGVSTCVAASRDSLPGPLKAALEHREDDSLARFLDLILCDPEAEAPGRRSPQPIVGTWVQNTDGSWFDEATGTARVQWTDERWVDVPTNWPTNR